MRCNSRSGHGVVGGIGKPAFLFARELLPLRPIIFLRKELIYKWQAM